MGLIISGRHVASIRVKGQDEGSDHLDASQLLGKHMSFSFFPFFLYFPKKRRTLAPMTAQSILASLLDQSIDHELRRLSTRVCLRCIKTEF